MSQALSQFNSNINGVQDLSNLYDIVIDMLPILKDKAEDMLRSEMVLAVSAFDCYIHDLIRFGILEQFGSTSGLPDAYKNFNISLNALYTILQTYDYTEKMTSLDNEIRKINGYKSFQESKKVSEALALLKISDLWQKVAEHQNPNGTTSQWNTEKNNIKKRLDNIVKRRNQIAHEADLDRMGNKNPIDRQDVTDDINFITSLCKSIDYISGVR